MITDERLDQLIRGALHWQADGAARSAPPLQAAVQRLLPRFGGPVLVRTGAALPATLPRRLNLVTVALLLIAVLAATAAVGAILMRLEPLPPAPLPPGQGSFGPGGACVAPPRQGVVLEVSVDNRLTTLYAGGELTRSVSAPPAAWADRIVDPQLSQRRLTPEGVQLMLDRLGDGRLTVGCRRARSADSAGFISATTTDGYAQVQWEPSYGYARSTLPLELQGMPLMAGGNVERAARRMSAADEAQALALATALERPETWLPPNAWLDGTERPVMPAEWLVIWSARGDAPPIEVPFADQSAAGSPVSCATVTRAQALAYAESLVDEPFWWGRLDLRGEYVADYPSTFPFLNIEPAYPSGRTCAAIVDEAAYRLQPPPLPDPAGDLAGIDPCHLMPPRLTVMGTLWTESHEATLSQLPLGVSARACGLFGSHGRVAVATVSLYPRSLSVLDAGSIAHDVFGHGAAEASVAGRPLWMNSCMAEDLVCPRVGATWSGSSLVFVEFDGGPVPLVWARAVVEIILEGLPD